MELLNVKLVVHIVTTGLVKVKSLANRRIHHRCEFVSLTLCKRCITKNLKADYSLVEFEVFALLGRYTAWIGSKRRFGTAYRSHPVQKRQLLPIFWLLGFWMWYRHVVPKRPLLPTNPSCITFQKSGRTRLHRLKTSLGGL